MHLRCEDFLTSAKTLAFAKEDSCVVKERVIQKLVSCSTERALVERVVPLKLGAMTLTFNKERRVNLGSKF